MTKQYKFNLTTSGGRASYYISAKSKEEALSKAKEKWRNCGFQLAKEKK